MSKEPEPTEPEYITAYLVLTGLPGCLPDYASAHLTVEDAHADLVERMGSHLESLHYTLVEGDYATEKTRGHYATLERYLDDIKGLNVGPNKTTSLGAFFDTNYYHITTDTMTLEEIEEYNAY